MLTRARDDGDHVNVESDTRGPRPRSEDDEETAARRERDLGQAPLLAWQQTEVSGRTCAFGVGGDGPTVVFLHGWGLSGPAYRAPLKRLLARGLRVFAPTLPGFGGTAPLPVATYGLDAYAAWVDAFCAAVGITEPVTLLGHSFGGGVAIQTALDHPDRVSGLVLINSIGGSAWRLDSSTAVPISERPLWDWARHAPHDLLVPRQLRRVLPAVLAAAIPNTIRNPRLLWRVATIARGCDLTDQLTTLNARRLPVAVVWSEQDRLITRASFDATRTALGNPTALTTDGTHSWLIADPDTFGELITHAIAITTHSQPSRPRRHLLHRLRAPRRNRPARDTPLGRSD